MPTDKVVSGHRRFLRRFEAERELFEHLAEKGQAPKVLWIGCSDSRVIPEQITSADPGELFILRNIANIVPPAGTGASAAGAAVEYAILHLQVAHAVVCGHSDCGGIKALGADLSREREPHIVEWLEFAPQPADSSPVGGAFDETRLNALIKANVLRQLGHLSTYRCVRNGIRAGTLALHGWFYDLHSGQVYVHDEDAGEWTALPSDV